MEIRGWGLEAGPILLGEGMRGELVCIGYEICAIMRYNKEQDGDWVASIQPGESVKARSER